MEIWKDILDYEGFYQVSNKGKVRSLDRTIINKRGSELFFKGQIMCPRINTTGYLDLNLRKEGTKRNTTIHKLVAEAFIGNRPNGLVINHIDENKLNNVSSNLEYVTYEYNNNWGTRNKRLSEILISNESGMSVIGKNLLEDSYIYFTSASAAQRITKKYFDKGAINRVNKGINPSHKGWEFSYADSDKIGNLETFFEKYNVKTLGDFKDDEEFTDYILSKKYILHSAKKAIYGIHIYSGVRVDYDSLTEASLDSNYDFGGSNISNVLAGRYRHHKGFKWFYKEN